MTFSSKTYNILKWGTMILMPALTTLVATIGPLWGLPYIDQIVPTMTALTAFMGALVGISTQQYNLHKPAVDGTLHVIGNETFVELEKPLEDTVDRDKVVFEVRSGKP